MIATLRAVSLGCDAPTALMEFERSILGGEVAFANESFAALQGADAIWLTAQRVEERVLPLWPAGDSFKQAHLELAVTELVDSVAAGARRADIQPSPDRWQVFIDPAGHPFCLTTLIATE